jgi:uncharacterized membrane protein
MNALVITLLTTLIPLNGLALWAFLNYVPKEDPPSRRMVFNALTFSVVPVMCAFFSLWLSSELGTQVEDYWHPVLGWISAFPVLLMIASGVRFYVWLRREEAMTDPEQ